MLRKNHYSVEEFFLNSSAESSVSDTQIYVKYFCDSLWFKGCKIQTNCPQTSYYIYSLNLSGKLTNLQNQSSGIMNYRAGTFSILKLPASKINVMVSKHENLKRKFMVLLNNKLHDIIVSAVFSNNTSIKLYDISRVIIIMNNIRACLQQAQTDNIQLTGYYFQLVDELKRQQQNLLYPLPLQKALDYINNNCNDKNLSREQIAAHVGISVRSLSNMFQQYLKVEFFNYVINLRLERVARMLKYSSTPIKEIASKCGYSTPNYLSRIFKNRYGVTCRDYRQKKYFG